MINKIPYRNFSQFILRTPLFPLTFIQDFVSGKTTSEDELKDVCRRSDVDEAIWLASPDLHSQMHEWLNGNMTDRKKVEKLHYGLMRYILRMCTRPTPFGLFAGYNVGTWEKESEVVLPPQEKYSRHTRLDMNYLCALAQDLAKNPVIKDKILYFPNSSIYPVGDQLRYVEYRYRNARRTHHIVAVDNSEYLQKVLDAANKGAYLKNLAELLVDDEITIDEAKEFIDELINSQLLVNELEPAITGPEFLDQIMDVLEKIDGIDDIKKVITGTKDLIEEIDNSQVGSTVSYYSRIAKHVEPLGTKYELKFLFQTDMVKPVETCRLDWKVARDALYGLHALNKLSSRPGQTNLTQFRDAFSERYETKEVPLLQAMDTESGVGYRQTRHTGDIAPLVDDLGLPSVGEAVQEIRWNRVSAMLFRKYREALREDLFEVELTDKDLEGFDASWDDLPDTISAMVKIIEGASEENPQGRMIMGGSGGSSAGNLLGRFCHGDEATDIFVKEISRTEKEMNPNAILAEILHLPESRVGNVLIRPVLREYEIPYLAKAAVPEEFQLKLDDLMVSVQMGRVVLRSKRLNKEIIPHLTNAHNYSYNALPVYHFLADLQTQNMRGGVGFNWGPLSGEYEFLPRVVYRNIIFSPALWNVRTDDLKPMYKMKNDDELHAKFTEWREKQRIPRHVLEVEGDNKLYLDLNNTLCIRTLFSMIKKRGGFQVEEFLPCPENGIAKGPEGVFTNEFVFSFFNAKKLEAAKKQVEEQEKAKAEEQAKTEEKN